MSSQEIPNMDNDLPGGDWRNRAACRDEDPEMFFPIGNNGPALKKLAEAKEVCGRCPVVAECLAWALDNNQDFGVWGAMSEDERRSLKRRQSRNRSRIGETAVAPKE